MSEIVVATVQNSTCIAVAECIYENRSYLQCSLVINS